MIQEMKQTFKSTYNESLSQVKHQSRAIKILERSVDDQKQLRKESEYQIKQMQKYIINLEK